MPQRRTPILVTGAHRSGTTWIGRTIAQHRSVRYVQEPFNVNHPNPKLETWFTHYPSSDAKAEIRDAFDNLLQSGPLRSAAIECASVPLDARTPARFLRHAITDLVLRPRALVKDPIALLSAGWLHEAYGFKVIVMIRNPLGFVGSIKKAGWDFDFRHLLRQEKLMSEYLQPYSEDMIRMCDPKSKGSGDIVNRASLLWNVLHHVIAAYQSKYPYWLYLRHEEVALDPERHFRRIFRHLGLSLDRRILRYIRDFTADENPGEVRSTAYQPRRTRTIPNAWKDRLSEDEISRVKRATGDLYGKLYTAP